MHQLFVTGQDSGALSKPGSLELQRRLEVLVRKAKAATLPFQSAEAIRRWRALEVLERINSAEARQHLRALAGGAPGAMLTQQAREVAERVGGSR